MLMETVEIERRGMLHCTGWPRSRIVQTLLDDIELEGEQ